MHKGDLTKTLCNLLDEGINLIPGSIGLPLKFAYAHGMNDCEKEILWLDKLLVSKDRLAIDIGANRGIYTYALSKLSNRVEAFEPQPWCARYIEEFAQSSKATINTHTCGLSDIVGVMKLKIPILNGRLRSTLATGLASFDSATDYAQPCNELDVFVRRLDDFNFKDVGFIKIDVEGHERRVIRGAKQTILREKPVLLVEIEQRHLGECPIESVFKEIILLGYKGFFLDSEELISINRFDLKKHQTSVSKAKKNSVFKQRYINNFIFKPC